MKKSFIYALTASMFVSIVAFSGCQGAAVSTTETIYSYTNPEVTDISIYSKPSILEYSSGEVLDLDGLVLTAKYNNGMTSIVTDFTTEPAAGTALTNIGTTTVNVNYKSYTKSFNVEVHDMLLNGASISGISIISEPKKELYLTGELLDLTNLVVIANYQNGDSKIITNYTTEPAAGTPLNQAGSCTVTVSYGSFTQNFKVTVSEQILEEDVYLESISVLQKPFSLSYERGSSFDSSGLIVSGKYSNGLVALINDYTLDIDNGSVLSDLGTKVVTVSKGSLSTNFRINVVERIEYGTLNTIVLTMASYNDISVSQEDITGGIKFTAPSGYEEYTWKVNGVVYKVSPESEDAGGAETPVAPPSTDFSFNTDDLMPGIYEVLLVARTEDNSYKSATIYVQVSE